MEGVFSQWSWGSAEKRGIAFFHLEIHRSGLKQALQNSFYTKPTLTKAYTRKKKLSKRHPDWQVRESTRLSVFIWLVVVYAKLSILAK